MAGNFFLKNMRLILGVVVVLGVGAYAGGTMAKSYNDYAKYEKQYNENDLLVRSAAAAAAQKVEVVDSFASKLKNKVAVELDQLTVAPAQNLDDGFVPSFDGSISVELNLAATSLADLDLGVRFKSDSEDFFADVNLKVNDSLIEDALEVKASDDFAHLALTGFALPEGKVTIVLESKSGKAASMPDLESLAFYSNAAAELPEAEA